MGFTPQQAIDMQQRVEKARYIPLAEKEAKPPVKRGRKTREENQLLIKVKQDTNSLTRACIDLLNMSGYKVWRNGNHAVYSKKQGSFLKPSYGSLNGVPDIIGYQKKTGLFIGVEIKTGTDKMSKEQNLFCSECELHHANYIIVRELKDLKSYINAIL